MSQELRFWRGYAAAASIFHGNRLCDARKRNASRELRLRLPMLARVG